MTSAIGRHFLIEMYDCDATLLNDPAVIESTMLCTARCCGSTIIHHHFHRFSPHGISGIVVIAESHLSIHTWPEHRYAAVDLFTCSPKGLPERCLEQLREKLGCERISLTEVKRGEDRAGNEHRSPEDYRPLHPEIFRYDAHFVTRFIAPEIASPQPADAKNIVTEVAEQIYLFRLFAPEYCRLLIEECEHRNAWVTILSKTEEEHPMFGGTTDLIEPDTTVSWECMPGMTEVYAQVIANHVRPVIEALWQTFKLQRWDPPAVRKFEPRVVSGMELHYDNEIVGMIGYLNTEFEGGGTYFPRWDLTIGLSGNVPPGSVAVYPGGISHEHLARAVTAGTRYMLANSFY